MRLSADGAAEGHEQVIGGVIQRVLKRLLLCHPKAKLITCPLRRGQHQVHTDAGYFSVVGIAIKNGTALRRNPDRQGLSPGRGKGRYGSAGQQKDHA